MARSHYPRDFWLNGAAPESNRASRGLHDLTGFEDRLGQFCKPAWILGFSRFEIDCATVFATVRAEPLWVSVSRSPRSALAGVGSVGAGGCEDRPDVAGDRDGCWLAGWELGGEGGGFGQGVVLPGDGAAGQLWHRVVGQS